MRKLLLTLMLLFATPALADYTFVVPQKPGGGTTVWAEIVAKELEPFLHGYQE
jgi:tripartite-type tricarboxylate transporter receptor subunit TctC